MHNSQTKLRSIVLSVCFAAVLVCIVNPFGVASGSRDFDTYSEIRMLLRHVKNSKPLFMSSDDDYFQFNGNSEIRKKYSMDFAFEGYGEIYSAASFGDWTFNKYLNDNHITHLLVPFNSAKKNRIQRKWGSYGNVSIDLRSPFFKKRLITSGEFPLVVYEINKTQKSKLNITNYALVWDQSTRADFFSQLYKSQEVGLYSYGYQSEFRDGPTVSWVMADSEGNSEHPSFVVHTSNSENNAIQLTIEFVSAYGSYAPVQVVTVSSEHQTKSAILSPGKPGRVVLTVRSGESIKLGNGLPCREANSFDPDTSDTRRFCYGLSRITAQLTKVG
jgi:hypothetical protein